MFNRMNERLNCIFIGPGSKVITGQSQAFNLLLSSLKEREQSVSVKAIYSAYFYNKVLDAFYVFFAWPVFFFQVLFFKPDVIYLSLSRSKLGFLRESFYYLIAKTFNIPIVVHLHGLDFMPFSQSIKGVWNRLFFFCFSAVKVAIVLLPKMKSQFALFPELKVISIPNFVDGKFLECFERQNLSVAELNEENSIGITYFSNLMVTKGVIDFLDALLLLPSSYHKRVKVTLAGKYMSDYQMSATRVEQLVNERLNALVEKGFSNIEYIGAVFGSEKFDLLRGSDVFILPSKHKTEAQPISILEAMSTGCAVITTKHNLLPDLVKDGVNGILVNCEAPAEICEALVKLIDNNEMMKRISKTNYSLVREQFTLEKHVASVLDALNEARL